MSSFFLVALLRASSVELYCCSAAMLFCCLAEIVAVVIINRNSSATLSRCRVVVSIVIV